MEREVFPGRDECPRHIYFVRNPETNLVKVGFTGSPYTRMVTLTREAGCRLDLLAISGGFSRRWAFQQERTLHAILAVSRHHGEWFYPSRMLSMMVDACTNDPGDSSVFGNDHRYVRLLFEAQMRDAALSAVS